MKSNDEISQWFDKILVDKSSFNKATVDGSNDKDVYKRQPKYRSLVSSSLMDLKYLSNFLIHLEIVT